MIYMCKHVFTQVLLIFDTCFALILHFSSLLHMIYTYFTHVLHILLILHIFYTYLTLILHMCKFFLHIWKATKVQ